MATELEQLDAAILGNPRATEPDPLTTAREEGPGWREVLGAISRLGPPSLSPTTPLRIYGEEAGLLPRDLTRGNEADLEARIRRTLIDAGIPEEQAGIEAGVQATRQVASGEFRPQPHPIPGVDLARLVAQVYQSPSTAGQVGRELSEGFVDAIARTAGLPSELIRLPLWAAAKTFKQDPAVRAPGESIEHVRRTFREWGLPLPAEDAVHSFAQRTGAATFDALLTALVMRGIGTGLPARPPTGPGAVTGRVPGENVATRVQRFVGEPMVRRPVSTTTALVAGAPGAVYGADIGGPVGEEVARAAIPDSEVAARGGELAGGFAGSLIFGAPGAMAGARLGQLRRAERPKGTLPPGTAPLADAAADPDAAAAYLRTQVEAATARQDDVIELAMRRIRAAQPASPGARSQIVMREVERVQDANNRIVNEAWDRVDRDLPVHSAFVNPARRAAQDMVESRDWRAIPTQQINNLNELTRLYSHVVPPGGPGQPAVRVLDPIPVGRLIELRNDILHAQRGARAGGPGVPPNDALARNLDILQTHILDGIDAAHGSTNNVVRTASTVSRMVHDRFSRSPLAQVMAATQRAEGRIAPEVAAGELMKDTRQFGTGGPASIQAASQPLPGSSPGLAMAMLQRGRHANQSMDEFILADFRQAVDDAVAARTRTTASRTANRAADAETMARSADKWRRQFEEAAQPFIRATTMIGRAIRDMNGALTRRFQVEDGAAARFFADQGRTTEAAVRRIMLSEEPTLEVQRLLRGEHGVAGLNYNPPALAGFRRQLFAEFLRSSGGMDIPTIATRFENPRWNNMFRAVLAPAEYARMERIIRTAEALATQGPTVSERGGRVVGKGLTFIGNWVGLHGGGIIARLTSGGTQQAQLSFPARGAAMGRNWASWFMNEMPVEVMFQRAIVDPRIERLLLSRMPNNRSELFRFAREADQAARRIQSGREALSRQLTEDETEGRERRTR